MNCPHCGKSLPETPTYKQLQAYLLVYIHGFSQREAARKMGVHYSVVNRQLRSLRTKRPLMMPSRDEMLLLKKHLSQAMTIG